MHQFGLWTSDTAIVLELGDTKVLNANDAKIAGLPLRRLLRRHGRFDFALRSHSSANARACLRVEGQAAVSRRCDALRALVPAVHAGRCSRATRFPSRATIATCIPTPRRSTTWR